MKKYYNPKDIYMTLRNSKVNNLPGWPHLLQIIEIFLQNYNKGICLNDLSAGYKKNFAYFMDHPNFQIMEGGRY